MFCLPKELANKIKASIRKGEFTPEKLKKMDTESRREFLENIIGTEAKEVNKLFEKKLLLKDQERGLYEWVKEILGLSKAEKEAMSKKIKETYSTKKQRVFNPKEGEEFLGELASDAYSKRFKTEVSLDEARVITDLSSEMATKKEIMNKDHTWGNGSEEDRFRYGVDYGNSKVLLDNYTGALKREAEKVQLVRFWREKGASQKLAGFLEDLRISGNFIADNSRAVVAALDNSLWMRQGIKTLTNPKYVKIWGVAFGNSFVDIFKTLVGGIADASKEVRAGGFNKDTVKKTWKALWGASNRRGDALQDALKAEIYSRRNYLNGLYERGSPLDIGTGEEEFPTSFPSKIPLLGRLFKASEVAYTSGAMRLRVDIADKLYASAARNKIDLNNKEQVAAINKLVNSLTGRGHLGRVESWGPVVNKTLFSAKFLKSNIDFLTQWSRMLTTQKGDPLNFAAKEAAANLLYTITSLTGTLVLADTLWPGSVEWDPRSADFAKIRIGDTRFDITGGLRGLVVLGARLFSSEVKSTMTGAVTEKKRTEILLQFGSYKLAPAMTAVKNLMNGEDFKGDDTTLFGEAVGLFTPIPFQNYIELTNNPQSANTLLTMIVEGLGISQGTYSLELPEEELLYKQFQNLDEEEREYQERTLKEDDPDLYEKYESVSNSEDRGLSATDRYLQGLGISNGVRATFIYNEAMKLGGAAEQNAIVQGLYDRGIATKTVLNQIEELNNLGRLDSVDVVKPEDRGAFGLVSDYARAFRIDPENAIKGLFSSEKLGIVQGNLVSLQRMRGVDYREEGGSQEVKKKMMEDIGLSWSDRGDYKLEHILPVKAGGDSSEDNLKIVTTIEHDMYTPIDNDVVDAVKIGAITREKAETLMKAYKDYGTLTAEAVVAQL